MTVHLFSCWTPLVGFRRQVRHKQKRPVDRRKRFYKALYVLAEWTGLEPATPGVTGRYSNQLNYHSLILHVKFRWWVLRGSNPRHSPCKGDALPTELSTRCADPNYFAGCMFSSRTSVESLPDAA